jgi:hypothetical protein
MGEKWEYHIINAKKLSQQDMLETRLNELGQQFWILACQWNDYLILTRRVS